MSVSKLSKQRGQILDEIMAHHRENLPKIKRQVPLTDVQAFATLAAPALDFYGALAAPGVSLIAECKKASPSKGLIMPDYDPIDLARTYVRGGARAISVLTDERHFQGTLADLRDVKELTMDLGRILPKTDPRMETGVPILRKDFVFDEYHIYEARAAGADAILLIAAVLAPSAMRDLLDLTHSLGMNALIEVHSEAELETVLQLNPKIVGVNNRNLQTFKVDFDNTARLRQLIPENVVVVGESGLKSDDDVRAMRRIGVDAVLVGESLVRKSKDRLGMVRQFVEAGRE